VRPRRGDNQLIDPSATETGQAPSGARSTADRVAAWIVPAENPGGAVYGAIVVGALLAAEAGAHETYGGTILASILATLLSWLAHSYAVVLGHRLEGEERLGVIGPMISERALLRGALLPLAVLLIGWAAGVSETTAVTAAIWSVIVSLVAFELIAGFRSHATRKEFVIDVSFGLTMGVGILALKILLH